MAILILQLFVKKPDVLRTYSPDSDRIFWTFHQHTGLLRST